MAIDVGAITLQLKAAETELAKYSAAAKTLDTAMKKKMSEFQMVNQGLWEGKDHIKELEKAREEAVKKLDAEIDAAKETFGKMVTNKIGPIKKNLSEMGTTAGNTAVMAHGLESRLKGLHTSLNGATGDKLKLAGAYEHVKKLETGANRTFVELNSMKLEIQGLANTPSI
ncbi:MAG TPA: hypothetical protein VGN88_04110 [Phycisphaerae bacterium]|jgi:hypothetical protein